MKRLVVHADDFGYTPGVNAGILRAHKKGLVTSTALMVIGPAALGAARLARGCLTLDVGVHLALSAAGALEPVLPGAAVPTLIDAHGRLPRVAPGHDVALDPEQIAREFEAQIARAIEMLGRRPSHLTTHHAAQSHPMVEAALAEVAIACGLAVRAQDTAQRQRFVAMGLRTTGEFTAAFDGVAGTTTDAFIRLIEALETSPAESIELRCRPGEVDDALLTASRYTVERAVELATLTASSARIAAAREFALVTWPEV